MKTESKRKFIVEVCKRVLKAGLNQDRSLGLLHLYLDQAGPGDEVSGEDLNYARGYIKAAFTRKAKTGVGMTDWKPKARLKPGVRGNAVATTIVRCYHNGMSWDETVKQIHTLLPSVKTWGIKKSDILEAISLMADLDEVDLNELIEVAEAM